MKVMEYFIGIVIGLIIGGSGGALGMSIWKDNWFATLPPKIIREEIRQDTKLETTVHNEQNTYQVQSTQVWNDKENILLSMTNQTAYSNLLSNVLTNQHVDIISTNWSTNN